jgi:hypothetical protein
VSTQERLGKGVNACGVITFASGSGTPIVFIDILTYRYKCCGSGSRRAKITQKSEEIASFEVLYDIFCGIKTSPVA